MHSLKSIVITGAAGNLGGKLCKHLAGRFDLRLIDKNAAGDSSMVDADIAIWDNRWVDLFAGADAVVHLAAESIACLDMPKLSRTNIDGTVNVFEAARRGGVRRVIFASTNHVLGRYKYVSEPKWITTDLEPRPGGRFMEAGWRYDSTAYATTKVFGERLGKCYSQIHDLEVIVVRFGFVVPGENEAENFPDRTDPWLRQLWLSNRDLCHLVDRCLAQELEEKFIIVHGTSNNGGSCWDMKSTERLLGFKALDGLTVDAGTIRRRPGIFTKIGARMFPELKHPGLNETC